MLALLVTPGIGWGDGGPGAPDGPPPVGQDLVPEGYFATRLAEALNLGTPQNGVDAESLLTSVGVTPKNGWIEAYPVTPEVVSELRSAIDAAATSGGLKMSRDEAVAALDRVVDAELGVTIHSEPASRSSAANGSDSVAPSAVNDYYGTEGPPVVTYYAPPPDYAYLYAWVPWPFWCNDFFFSGFFVLSDFDVDVDHGHRHRHDRDHDFDGRHHEGEGGHHDRDRFEVTNHVIDSRTRAISVVDPVSRERRSVTVVPKMGWDYRNRTPTQTGTIPRSSGAPTWRERSRAMAPAAPRSPMAVPNVLRDNRRSGTTSFAPAPSARPSASVGRSAPELPFQPDRLGPGGDSGGYESRSSASPWTEGRVQAGTPPRMDGWGRSGPSWSGGRGGRHR